MWYICIVEFYSAIKKMTFGSKWMELEKNLVCIFSYVDVSCEVKDKHITIRRNTEVRYRIKD